MPAILEHLTDSDWTLLLGRAQRQAFRPGDMILRQDDMRLALYLMQRGFARIQRDEQGSAVAINTVGPGELFGEMSFLEGTRASASVVAVDDVEIDVIDGAAVQSLLVSDPGLSARFYRSLALTLSARLRRASIALAQLQVSDVPNTGQHPAVRTGHVQERQIPPELVEAVRDFRRGVEDAAAALARRAIEEPAAQNTVSAACDAVVDALERHTAPEALVDASLNDPFSFRDPGELAAGFGAYVFREGFPIFMASATLSRCHAKPRGYAGDWETLQRMHRDEPEGEGRLGALVDRWFLDRPLCRTIRASRDWMASLIVDAADSAAGRPLCVTCVASKAGSEVLDAMAARPGAIRATCLDGDPAAVHEGARLARRLGVEQSVSFVHANITRVAAGELPIPLPPQHMISALGLFEYLTDEQVIALLDWAHATLAPGGAFVGTNIVLSASDRVLAEHILEWPMISRGEDALRELVARSAFAEIELARDAAGGTVFLRCVRQ